MTPTECIAERMEFQRLGSRRVVAKAEHLAKGADPRFIVTSLGEEEIEARRLYERI